jgi:putative phosphoesterase
LHGHRYDVKGTTADLIEEAENMAVDIVVYGHTHIVDVTERKNLLVLNPGSVSRPRFYGSPKTCMRLAIDGGKVSVEIIDLA